MARKGLFDRVRSKVRDGMNEVVDKISDFESKGGLRGAAERARARAERTAKVVYRELQERGVEIGRFVPLTPDEEIRLRKHHRTLGVKPGASFDEIKAAYRREMREHHPDKHAGNPAAEKEATKRSQDITIAYEALERYHRMQGTTSSAGKSD